MKTLFNYRFLSVAIVSLCHPVFAENIEEVVVTASPLVKNAETVSRPVSVLSGDALHNAATSTLGETLQGQLGVSSASFGPGVGLPIIRGQSDNRVKVMRDSVGSMDASAASPDHAVTIEPLLATKIEVLRGPAALRYGSGAIGGVVNVLDNRIANELPDGIDGGVELRNNSVNNETTGVVNFNAGISNLAVHIDAIKRDSSDIDIPGYALKNPENSAESIKGYVANTDAQYKAGTFGTAYIAQEGFIGVSVNKLDNNYGVPPDSDELIRLDMHQTRYDLKGELNNPFAGFKKITTHIGHTDYNHTEIENGEPGTEFTNNAYEGRVELVHNPYNQWNGAVGLQAASSTFAAIGEEAFIPKSDIRSVGIFIIEEITRKNWTYELGLRGDFQSITPEVAEAIKHTSVNLSGTTSRHLTPNQQLILGVAQSQRAPSIEESLANGPHPATGRYLTGDRHLREETSTNFELGHHWHKDGIQSAVNVFYNIINDYIYARDLDQVVDELKSAQYTQEDAIFKGIEGEIKTRLTNSWHVRFFGDYVRATLNNGSDLPRITPLRFGSAFDYSENNWSGNFSVTRSARQNHPGHNESETDGYVRVDARVGYLIAQPNAEYLIFIKGTNLLDEEIRNASSYLRDIAPEAGRGIQAGFRITF